MSASGTKPDNAMPWGNAFARTDAASPEERSQNLLGMMEIESPKLQSKTLRRAPDVRAYKLYRAAQEWDLIDPILIRDRKDLKSEPMWREHIQPLSPSDHESSHFLPPSAGHLARRRRRTGQNH